MASILTLEKNGLRELVGDFIEQIYYPHQIVNYETITNEFNRVALSVPENHRGLFQFFNPQCKRTKEFIQAVSPYGGTLGQVIDAIREYLSFPSNIIARGIMGTHLNLPYTVYPALEESYLEMWRETRGKSQILKGAELDYVREIYYGRLRYERALKKLETILKTTSKIM